MALLERLAILITADASGAINEMKKVAAEAEKNLGKAGDAGSNFSGQMTKVGAAMVGAGAGLLAVGISAASSTTQMGREVIKLQRYTGMTAEEASKLRGVAQLAGVSVDSLSIGLGRLSKAAEANSPAFNKLGISTHDSNGSLRSMGELLPEVAEKFKTMPAGAERTALALQLFGRNGMDMMPFLIKGRDGIAELSREAEKMGLVLSGDNINAIKNHIVAQRELTATFDGLKTKIGLQMLPVLTGFTDIVKGIPGPVLDVIGPLTVFGGLGLTAAGGIGMIVGQLGNFAKFATVAYNGAGTLVTKLLSMPMAFGIAGAAVAALAGGIYLLRSHLNDVSTAAAKGMGDLSKFGVDELKQKIADVNREMASIAPKEREWILMGAEAIRRATTGDDERYASLQGQKKALEDALGAAESGTGITRTLAEAQQAAADATDNHTSAIKTLNDTMNASLDPFTKAIDAANGVGEAQRKLTESNAKVYWTQIAYNEAVRKYGVDSDEARTAADNLAQAQRDLDAAQGNAFKTALEYEQSIKNLGASMHDHPEIYKQNIDKINEMERAGVINTETAERMRKKLTEVATAAGAIPGNAGTYVWADTEDAKRKLEEIKSIIRDITGVDNTLNGEYGRGLGIKRAPGSAVGGRVGVSDMRLIGELGPELFVPDTAGTIVTADRTAQMLGGGGSTVVINAPVEIHTVTGDPAAIERVVLDAIGRAHVRGMTALRP